MELLSFFTMERSQYQDSHTAGHPIRFARPCIGYLLKGKSEFLSGGKTYHAEAGDLIYIAADTQYYSMWSGEPEICFYSISFAFRDRSSFYGYRFQILKDYPPERLHRIFESYAVDSLAAVGEFYLLLSELFPKLEKESVSPQKIFIDPAVEYLEAHYTEPISVAELAKQCNCSEPYFYALFRTVTGISPIHYKHNLLVQHALHMLCHTDRSIEEISDLLGFSSPNYFRKIFVQVTGKKPSEVRRSQKTEYPEKTEYNERSKRKEAEKYES